MNMFLMPLIHIVAVAEGAGGLFDFNATLPLMAIQFILLTVLLTFVFYKPVRKVLEERETTISINLADAYYNLLEADERYKLSDVEIKTARRNAQLIIAKSEQEAKDILASEINQAREDAAKLIQQRNKELEAKKLVALQKLGTEIDKLTQHIKHLFDF
jgi:F-type H+-transporting ATPase subunit b